MIDLHSHILAGIDDGPDSLEGSLALARSAVEAGTHLMAATPHVRGDHPRVRLDEIASRCRALEAAMARHDIPLQLIPAGEVDLLWAVEASDAALRVATYGQRGTHLLLETPYGPLPWNFSEFVRGLSARGFIVVLAHPERNPTFQRNPELILDLVSRGVLVQLTGLSLAHKDRGSRSRKVARWLVERGAAHLIASDAHGPGPWRGPDLRPAIAVAEGISPARAEWMTHEVPQAVVAGEPVPRAPFDQPGGVTFWRPLRARTARRTIGMSRASG
jgi:protein-tyrosine phosphatase